MLLEMARRWIELAERVSHEESSPAGK